jgi:hypothetical protein
MSPFWVGGLAFEARNEGTGNDDGAGEEWNVGPA